MEDPSNRIKETHTVPDGANKERLSEYARGVFESLPSRKSVKKAIKKNLLLVNGKPTETGHWVRPGEVLSVVESDRERPQFSFELEILFEDDRLAAIFKPGDLLVSGNQLRTVVNALEYNLKPSPQKDALVAPQPVHRLDRQTSGILLVAKTISAAAALGSQFEERKVDKRYLAIVKGKVPSDFVSDEDVDGKPAKTEFALKRTFTSKKFGPLSEVEARPITGRRNQIREHLSNSGFPILGDIRFGGEKSGRGLFLFARYLSFSHPEDNRVITIERPLPRKFQKV